MKIELPITGYKHNGEPIYALVCVYGCLKQSEQLVGVLTINSEGKVTIWDKTIFNWPKGVPCISLIPFNDEQTSLYDHNNL